MKKYLFLLFYAAFLFASCSGDDIIPDVPITIPTYEDISPVFTSEGGTKSVSFSSTSSWTAKVVESQTSWCKVSPASGESGNHTLTIIASANYTPDSRTATVQLASGNVTKNINVTQKQKNAITVTTNKFELPAEGGNIDIEVKANVELSYTIGTSGKSWISYVETKAMKTSHLIFNVSANEKTEAREAKITVSGWGISEVITVTQKGVDVLSISTNNIEIDYEQCIFEVSVISSMGYEIKPQVDWIREITNIAVPDNIHVFEVSENSSSQAREGIIVLCNDAQTCIPVTVMQAGAEQEDTEWMTKEFFHKSLGMRFAADWCGACPFMAMAFDNAKSKLPGNLEVLSLHASGGLYSAVSEALATHFGISAFPTGYVDGRVKIPNYDPSITASIIIQTVNTIETNFKTVTGVRWTSAVSGNKVSLDLQVYLKVAGSYKVTALLVEDNIVGYQSGVSDNYVHKDVVRAAFSNATGDEVSVSSAQIKDFKYTLSIPDVCNRDNLRIVVYVQQKEEDGNYYVNNVASTDVGEYQPLVVKYKYTLDN